jgi:DNA-binding NarL/FixJ family response regulator
MGKIRVALAEDNVLLREGVSRLVSANEEFELVGTASDLPQLLALVREQLPDVVITDIRMPPTGTNEGIQAAAWLHENHPGVGVVVLSQYTAPAYAMALLEHGSAGRAYLLKERVASVDELARAIRAVAQGGSVIDPMVVDELVRSRSGQQQPGMLSLRSWPRWHRARATPPSRPRSACRSVPWRSTPTRSSPSSVSARRRTSTAG